MTPNILLMLLAVVNAETNAKEPIPPEGEDELGMSILRNHWK
jgi:hypothetical protein